MEAYAIPYPPRITVFSNGRQAKPKRGPNMSSTGSGPTFGFFASTILFPKGISDRLPSPGMQGAAFVVLHAGSSLPPPTSQLPVAGSSSLVWLCTRLGVEVWSYRKPRVTVSFGVTCHLSSKYGAQLGKLKSK